MKIGDQVKILVCPFEPQTVGKKGVIEEIIKLRCKTFYKVAIVGSKPYYAPSDCFQQI